MPTWKTLSMAWSKRTANTEFQKTLCIYSLHPTQYLVDAPLAVVAPLFFVRAAASNSPLDWDLGSVTAIQDINRDVLKSFLWSFSFMHPLLPDLPSFELHLFYPLPSQSCHRSLVVCRPKSPSHALTNSFWGRPARGKFTAVPHSAS